VRPRQTFKRVEKEGFAGEYVVREGGSEAVRGVAGVGCY
jgi:hypothetical protein